MRSLALVAVIAAATVSIALSRSGSDNAVADAGGNMATRSSCDRVNFDRYTAGDDVEGIRATKTVRQCEPDPGPAPARINLVNTLYGTCAASDDAGCMTPVQVQSWPACERNLALYRKYPSPDGEVVPYEETTIRGVPAAVFDDGLRIEVYTGDATIVIFGENRGLTRAAANKLTGVHDGRVVSANEPLPAPVDGAMEDKLAC